MDKWEDEMSRFGLVVRFFLKPGQADSFDRCARELISAVGDYEPGAIVFACHAVEGHEDQRVFYELYRDRAAFDSHGDQPHTKRFLAERDRHVEAVEVDFLVLTFGAGV